MVWFFVLLFAFVALFVRALWLAGKDPRVKARVEADEQKPVSKHEQVHQEALRQRARAIKAARVMSASGLVEQAQDEHFDAAASEARVKAAVQAARERPVQPADTQQANVNGMGQTQPTQMTFSYGVFVREKTSDEEHYAELNRQATEAKNISYAQAVALLQEAKQIMGEQYEETRLAKFMQQAGQFDGAIAEIDWLVSKAPQQVARDAEHLPQEEQAYFLALKLSDIYEAAALICKRAGRQELRQRYMDLWATQAALARKLDPFNDGSESDVLPTPVEPQDNEMHWPALTQEPFYLETMELVRRQLRATPGILQSELTKAAAGNADQLRQVLYVAEKAGHVRRVKKGRSYQLFLPE